MHFDMYRYVVVKHSHFKNQLVLMNMLISTYADSCYLSLKNLQLITKLFKPIYV